MAQEYAYAIEPIANGIRGKGRVVIVNTEEAARRGARRALDTRVARGGIVIGGGFNGGHAEFVGNNPEDDASIVYGTLDYVWTMLRMV
jgi:hypothetical protein